MLPESYEKMRVQSHSGGRKEGFSVLEMVVVIAVALILMAVIFPNLVNAIHNAKLRGGTSEFSGIVQLCRSRAVKDSRFYSVYIHASSTTEPQEAYVDIYPQNVNRASGHGGTQIDPQDPVVEIVSEVTAQPQSAAPSTAALAALLLPNNPNNIPVTDASTTTNPITFGPEGLPCIPYQIPGITGGTVCNTRGAQSAVAYWIFFQDSSTQGWEAVTVSPAGRIEKWAYTSGSWRKL